VSAAPRHVILVRHAHAEWPAYVGADLNRPLTPQGLADAHRAAAAILDAGHRPDLILTSPAKRTLQTAAIIATTLGLPDAAVKQAAAIYNATPDALEAALRQAFTTASIVLLVAHNPGISALARRLTGDAGFAAFRPAHWLHIPCNPG
jgi:phosphohistidine phosphatase